MTTTKRATARTLQAGWLAWALAAASVCAQSNADAPIAPPASVPADVERAATQIATELSTRCPVADPGSQAAFDRCRKSLYSAPELRRLLPDYLLWGRQSNPKLSLKDSKLTQFAPDVFTGLYLPLFTFDGSHTVRYVEREGLYEIRLRTAFRNRLAPGQFPYPFWHDSEKWSMYQRANDVIFWWDAGRQKIKVAQFTVFGANPPLLVSEPMKQPAWKPDEWMWTDAQGKTQPMVTLFDGLLSADNPYIGKLDTAYKSLALQMRESQCNQCHVPNNPDGMKRLVLLQTPAHAAGEVKRLLKSVRDDKMPRDEVGIEKPLDPTRKAALLADAEAFDKLYDAAKEWEATAAASNNVRPRTH